MISTATSKEVSRRYRIKNDDFEIEVEVFSDTKLMKIVDNRGNGEFVFNLSKPKAVRKIGELLVAAARLQDEGTTMITCED